MQQDAATGQTPRKKRIIVPQSWKVSAKHEDILKAVREKRLFDEGITTTTTSYSSSSTTTTSTPSSETIDTATATADYVQMQVSPPLDVIEANPSLFFVETNVISEDHATPRKETSKLPLRTHLKRPRE